MINWGRLTKKVDENSLMGDGDTPAAEGALLLGPGRWGMLHWQTLPGCYELLSRGAMDGQVADGNGLSA